MPTEAKVAKVTDLTDKMDRAKSVVLTDYRGLSVAQMQDLKKKIEAQGGVFEVTKNTLLERSLGDKKVPPKALQGPTAVLFAFQDEVAPFRVLQEFIKANSLPSVKVGFLGSELLDEEKVGRLAKLPSREALLGQLVGALNANQYKLAQVLSGNIRKLLYALDGVRKAKS
jgi:large subunit ribosomal protein L10